MYARFFSLQLRGHTRSTRSDTLLPYWTLFRSDVDDHAAAHLALTTGAGQPAHGRTAGDAAVHDDPAGVVRTGRAATAICPRAVIGAGAVFRLPPRLARCQPGHAHHQPGHDIGRPAPGPRPVDRLRLPVPDRCRPRCPDRKSALEGQRVSVVVELGGRR